MNRSNRIDRRDFLLALLAGTLAAPLLAETQSRARVYRIGFVGLCQAAAGKRNQSEEILLATLRDLGYVDGKNLVMEWRYGGDSAERYAEVAAELVRLRVDAVVTAGMPAARAVKHANNLIPIVMAVSEEPVGAGLAESLARPGGNVTGFTRGVEHEVMTKTLELFREAIPVSRVGLMVHESNGGIERIATVAAGLGIVLRRFDIRTVDDIARIYANLSREPIDGLYVLGNIVTAIHRQQIVQLSAVHRIPTVYWWRQAVSEGGLMSYGIDFDESWRGAAQYVDRILRGANPGTLPIQQPTKFEFVVNLKTAKALKLTIPPSLLLRADQVIE